MSTRSYDSLGERLARDLDQRIEHLIAALLLLMSAEGGDAAFLETDENSGRISEIRALFYSLTLGMMDFGAGKLAAIYSIPEASMLDESAALRLQQQLNQRLDGLITEAQLLSGVFEGDLVSDLESALLFTPANANALRKAADFAAAFSGQEGVWHAICIRGSAIQ